MKTVREVKSSCDAGSFSRDVLFTSHCVKDY